MIFINDAIFCWQFKSSIIENTFKKHPAKVLLFGEYTVIDGGPALAIPMEKFYGSWNTSSKDDSLVPFFKYLMSIPGYNHDKLNVAIHNRWSFESSIPQGYGAGSSGALSAAAYDYFYQNKPSEIQAAGNTLSQTESFFHGKSSGLDPLTSYYNKAILKKNDCLEVLPDFKLPSGFYLYDSLQKRNTRALVKVFLELKETQSEFRSSLIKLDALNQKMISSLLNQEADFSNILHDISLLQFDAFSLMIPDEVKSVWEYGLQSGLFDMKLSGAGGGGYFLLYAKVNPKLNQIIPL